jgi:large subunit ribosomal protein L30e
MLSDSMNTGKIIIGTRKVLSSIKGSKFVIFSSFLPNEVKSEIRKGCNSSSIPFLDFNGTSFELGKLCNKPFVISAIAIKSPIDSNLLTSLTQNSLHKVS